MKDLKDFHYALRIPPERLEFYAKLTPEQRLQWLEEAHEFVSEVVPYETVKRWKDFIKGGYTMEKATLSVTKTKKGTFCGNLVLSDGKQISVSDLKLNDATLNGKEVEVQREKGQVIKITCDGRVIYEKGGSQGQSNPTIRQNQSQNHPSSGNYSQAPYNFVPLNRKVVSAEAVPEFDKYHEDRHTGYIELEIKTLTPLYIRDTLTEEEYRKKLALERQSRGEDKRQYINPDFFSPGGLLRIPGSSIRGMIRTMVEIVSFGKFGFFEDARLYYRAVGDTSKLGIDYRDRMVDTTKNYYPKFNAGLLRKKGNNKYEILPSKVINNTQIYRINFDKKTGIIDGTDNLKLKEFEFKEVYFKPLSPQDYTHYRIDKKTNESIPYELCYAKLPSVRLIPDNSHLHRGYIVSSGHMDKKHMHWVINEPDSSLKPIAIDEDVVNSYKNDKQRKAPDLLKKLNETKEIPCFYLTDQQGRIISFGHTGMFRLAYEKTIGDHIPSALKDPNSVDLAEAIFGNEKTHAGRVFFEDAYLEGDSKEALLDTAIPKILSGPKPTCFQHYLEQNEQKSDNLQEHPKNLAHYNSDNPIRGYKLYWHRSGEGWIESNQKNIKSHQSQYTRIIPISAGSGFNGNLRFENLSKVELGALLFALDLPQGLAHKIGMGKPLGLGSVRITPKLFLSNRKQRYSDLFAEFSGLNDESSKIADFKKAFESYVLHEIGSDKHSLFDESRMLELKKMLDYANKPSDEKTEYLALKEFKKRGVLPHPTEI